MTSVNVPDLSQPRILVGTGLRASSPFPYASQDTHHIPTSRSWTYSVLALNALCIYLLLLSNPSQALQSIPTPRTGPSRHSGEAVVRHKVSPAPQSLSHTHTHQPT